jgi:hypothetical protein
MLATLSKTIYRYNSFPIKTLMTFFTEIGKSILKFTWKHRRLRIAKVILMKKNDTGDILIPDVKLCYRITVTKIAWYWHKDRQINGIG